MALTATASQGFELYDYLEPHQTLWIPGDPGDTFTRGDRVVATVGEGVLDPAAANEGGLVGRVEKTVVCAAATTAFPKPQDFDPATDSSLTLIPISLGIAAKIPRYRVTFANQADETVVSWTAATRGIAATTGHGADDRPNGALTYVYEGPGIGEVNVVEDYDHTGGAAELLTILHRKTATDLTTASKYIVLAGEAAASRGVGFFNRAEGADQNNLTVDQGADDGDYVVCMSWEETARNLSKLMLLVIDARYLMLA